MTAYPFVNFKQHPTKEISSTPSLIFGSQFGCIIDGLIISNQTDSTILFSLYLLREEGEPTPVPVEYPVVSNRTLAAKDSIDIFKECSFTMEPEDTLYAYSDYVDNLFNTFVSYRELNELTPTPQSKSKS